MTQQKTQHNRRSKSQSTRRHNDALLFVERHDTLLLVAVFLFFFLSGGIFASPTTDFLFRQGNQMLRSGYVSEGAALFRQLLASPHDMSPTELARVKNRLERVKNSEELKPPIANDFITQATRMSEQAIDELYRNGESAKLTERLSAALDLLECAAYHRGREDRYCVLMANCLIYLGRLREGKSFMNKVIKLAPHEPATWNMLAWYYRSSGKKRLELKALNRSVQLNEDQMCIQGRRCELLLHFDTPALRDIACKTAIKAAQRDLEYLAELAELFPPGAHREQLEDVVREAKIRKARSGTACVMGIHVPQKTHRDDEGIPLPSRREEN